MFLWIILVVFAMVVNTLRQVGIEVDQSIVMLVVGALMALALKESYDFFKKGVL